MTFSVLIARALRQANPSKAKTENKRSAKGMTIVYVHHISFFVFLLPKILCQFILFMILKVLLQSHAKDAILFIGPDQD